MAANPAQDMGMLMGAMTAGVVCGLIPLAVACRKRRLVVAIVVFALTIVAGLAGGFILGLPVAFILSLVVKCIPEAAANLPTMESMGYIQNPYAGGKKTAFGADAECSTGGSATCPSYTSADHSSSSSLSGVASSPS
jgi:hypothetical protein